MTITFSSQTQTENGYDYIYILDSQENQIGKYTGTALSSKTITVYDDTAIIKLTSDSSVTNYGFKIDNITVTFKGDLNGDNKICKKDLVKLKKVLVYSEQEEFASADINKNGLKNAEDITILKSYILNILSDL